MKKHLLLALLMILSLATLLPAAELNDLSEHASCQYCGMNRDKFGFSRMLIQYDDGTSVGLCSLHCAAVDLANHLDKAPIEILVADHGTRELTDAEKAYWVLGGDIPGVMTAHAKWAFAKKADAEAFQKAHGGEIVNFETAIKAAYEDMYQDTRMIREKRMMKKMKKQ